MIRKLIIISIIAVMFGSLLPIPCFAQLISRNVIQAPETIEEAKEVVYKIGEEVKGEMPGILEQMWRGEVLPIWQAMWDWFKVYIWSRVERIWQRVQRLLGKEIEERVPMIEEELQREAEEIKKELPEIDHSLWERFLRLIR